MAKVTRMERATAYILAHPDESIREQALGAEVSEPMISRIRRSLVADGKLAPARNARTPMDQRPKPTPAPAAPAAPTGPPMLDHAAMVQIADLSALLDDDTSDEEVAKAMLKQAIRFSFDPFLHADTRMSAQTLWGKLTDRKREKNLGPGEPMTFEAGARRLADLMLAAGPEMTTTALHLAFEVRDEGREVPAQPVQAAPDLSGTPPAS